jgi:hypothetical protein
VGKPMRRPRVWVTGMPPSIDSSKQAFRTRVLTNDR